MPFRELDMNAWLWIAGGAVLGAWLRFSLQEVLGYDRWPVGTMVANLGGCVLIGVVWQMFGSQVPAVKYGVLIGFLGSLTTMSGYALEVFRLMKDGHVVLACVYWTSGSLFSILAVGLGVVLGSGFTKP